MSLNAESTLVMCTFWHDTVDFSGSYAVENISLPLASQADFSAAGHERVPLANRIITEKIDSVMSKCTQRCS
jgi:hypothetical protein